MWELWPVLVVGVAIVYSMLRLRETFVIKYGNPFDNEDLMSFEPGAKGTRLFSTTPDTCPTDKSDYADGLCYEPCEDGYSGNGPVCWASTVRNGAGTISILRNCTESGYAGWNDWGLVCHQPIKCATGLAFFKEGCSGGNVRAKQLACDAGSEYPDFVVGMCYKKCPKEKPTRVGGMPYLCYKGNRGLSYGRGVGTVPPLFHFGA
jgi:hypothetical protein